VPEVFDLKEQSRLFAADTNSGWVTAYTDGGARGNPGPAGYGVQIVDENGAVLAQLSQFLGLKTNNFAEYSALLGALEYALANKLPKLRVVSDSELMVKQIQGRYKVASPDLRPLFDEAKKRIRSLQQFEIQHVLRGKNKEADRLANLAMDRGMGGAANDKLPTSHKPQPYPSGPPPVLTGIVEDGRVRLLDGKLKDGTRVLVKPEID
jgi:ribonuclease HI